MIIIGVDPGITGGIAVLDDGRLIKVYDMPVRAVPYKKKTRNVVDGIAVYEIFCEHDPNFIIIEEVHAMPKNGATSMFNFGYAAATVFGVACSFWKDTDIQFVTPQAWKKKMNLLKTEKDDARLRCIEIFSSHSDWFKLKKHSGRADASLIALASYLNWTKE